MHHDVKIWPQFFCHVKFGNKNFEVRKNDRGYQAGDTITLHEWDPKEITQHSYDPLGGSEWKEPKGYTGDKCGPFRIGYVLPIDAERVVFSLLPMEKSQ